MQQVMNAECSWLQVMDVKFGITMGTVQHMHFHVSQSAINICHAIFSKNNSYVYAFIRFFLICSPSRPMKLTFSRRLYPTILLHKRHIAG